MSFVLAPLFAEVLKTEHEEIEYDANEAFMNLLARGIPELADLFTLSTLVTHRGVFEVMVPQADSWGCRSTFMNEVGNAMEIGLVSFDRFDVSTVKLEVNFDNWIRITFEMTDDCVLIFNMSPRVDKILDVEQFMGRTTGLAGVHNG